MITKENVISQLLHDDVIVQSYVYSYRSKKYWKIEKPVTVELSNGKIITIPVGFYYDMSTVPKWLWSFVRPFNDALIAYLIHDYLYINREHGMTRKQVDQEMRYWADLTNKNKTDNHIRYFFVRAFGWLWWKKIF
jgi:hypothetical protein